MQYIPGWLPLSSLNIHTTSNKRCFVSISVFKLSLYHSLFKSQVANQTGAYPGFRSMKQLVVFLLSPGCDASPLQFYLLVPNCLHLGGERSCESKMSCPRIQHKLLKLILLVKIWLAYFLCSFQGQNVKFAEISAGSPSHLVALLLNFVLAASSAHLCLNMSLLAG